MRIRLTLPLHASHTTELRRQARAVSVVWNYCNATQKKAALARRRWLTAYDLMALTAGAGKLLDLHAHTVQRVCKTYDETHRVQRLAWVPGRDRRSLGWVPFNTGHVLWDGRAFVFRGVAYVPTEVCADLEPGERFGSGCFVLEHGVWSINVGLAMPGPANAGPALVMPTAEAIALGREDREASNVLANRGRSA